MAMSFGVHLKAARLRYGVLPAPAEGLMRLTPVKGGTLCELRPLGPVPSEKDGGREHVIWWEKDYGRPLIEVSPYLRSVGRVTEYTAVLLDEHGCEVKGDS